MTQGKRFILWAWSEKFRNFPETPFKIAFGGLKFCRAYERRFRSDYADALTAIYELGDEPKGLTLQVRERIGADAFE